MSKPGHSDEQLVKMSLVEHLSELRKRLIIVAVFFLATSSISFQFVRKIADELMALGNGFRFVYLAPSELFMQYFYLSIICGVVLTSPVIVYEIWRFICPGLKKQEKRAISYALLCGFGFFAVGAVFAYYVMIPIMLQFFLNMSSGISIEPMISFANYVGFISSTILTFGLVFEMPVVVMTLTRLGLLKPKWLTKNRGAAILVIFVVAAIITPPDVVSQTLVAVPMVILYELSVVLSKAIFVRRQNRQQQLEA